MIELPAALSAATAQVFASSASRRATRPTDTISYRVTEVDPAIRPGTIVTLPVARGLWRIAQWEWQQDGVLLSLSACHGLATNQELGSLAAADPGRFNAATDLVRTPTILQAFALPWDGNGASSSPAVFAAASGASAGWTGAALLADLSGDGGALTSLGSTGRTRARIGHALSALPLASPLLIDCRSTLDVALTGPDQTLVDASLAQMMQGANRARLGNEIIQFATATPLGSGVWRLSNFLRGRGGTEWAIETHAANDAFVMIDDALVRLDPALIGDVATTKVVAVGLGDTAAVSVSIADAKATQRPLSPVHGTAQLLPDGAMAVSWVRRSRGAWLWTDGVDAPLNEEAERWEITVGDPASPVLRWQTTEAALTVSAAQLAALPAGTPTYLAVRQIGQSAASIALRIDFPS